MCLLWSLHCRLPTGMYAIRHAFCIQTICAIVEAGHRLCRITQETARRAVRSPSVSRRTGVLTYYAFTDIACMEFYCNAMATECERSRRRRHAETELPTVSRHTIELDHLRRRRDSETPKQTARRWCPCWIHEWLTSQLCDDYFLNLFTQWFVWFCQQ